MHTCTWYISDSVSDVLAQVIMDMANALRSHSRDIDLQVINAKDFRYKAGYERIRNIFLKREIWHLFGKAPLWWRIVRIHSRTVHTRLEGDCGGGWPSRFFTEGAKSGEAVIFPVFDPLSSAGGEGKHAVFIRDGREVPKGDYEVLDISQEIVRPEALSGVYIANETTPREAMRAGILTMRGLAVASQKSGYLDEILGPDGYFVLNGEGDEELERVIRNGLGGKGKHTAMSARHFLKSRRSHERCTDSIITLYRKVIAQ